MANGRNPSRKKYKADRDGNSFVAMPWAVLDSDAYKNLGNVAKVLLMEVARQYIRDNNGRLLCSLRYLKTRGFNSSDTLTRAKRELLDAGFIYETVRGHRPNRASWYAVTWAPLDKITGYDAGAVEGFRRSAYNPVARISGKLFTPPHGTNNSISAPISGATASISAPATGLINPTNLLVPRPPDGDHLEEPSPRRT